MQWRAADGTADSMQRRAADGTADSMQWRAADGTPDESVGRLVATMLYIADLIL
jgi:hypothetical protein